jgi:hypothetical protein
MNLAGEYEARFCQAASSVKPGWIRYPDSTMIWS